jgi:hypothetical protein
MSELFQEVGFPLSDGTSARMTRIAAFRLSREFGIEHGRVKKGRGGDCIVARVQSSKYPDAKEVNLRDLLAYFVYGMFERSAFRSAFKTDRGRKFFLRDGDARNLMPSNVAVTEDSAPEEIDAETKPYAPRAKAQARATTLSVDKQLDIIAEPELQKSMLRIAISRLRSKFLAEEILGCVVLSIVEQIRAEKYVGVTGSTTDQQNHFRQWVRSAAFRQSEKRALAGIFLGDVESDPAAIRLRRVLQYEKKMGVTSPDRHALALQLESTV